MKFFFFKKKLLLQIIASAHDLYSDGCSAVGEELFNAWFVASCGNRSSELDTCDERHTLYWVRKSFLFLIKNLYGVCVLINVVAWFLLFYYVYKGCDVACQFART